MIRLISWLYGMLLLPVLPCAQTLLLSPRDVAKQALTSPHVRSMEARAAASAEGPTLIRQDRLPHLDLHAQAAYATLNNIYGMLFPQDVLYAINGPPVSDNDAHGYWNSGLGVGLQWQPWTFGKRHAEIEAAEAEALASDARLRMTSLDQQYGAVATYLDLIAAEALLQRAVANRERADSLLLITRALCSAGLQAGADSTIAKADVAYAGSSFVRSRDLAARYRIHLALLLGQSDTAFHIWGHLSARAVEGSMSALVAQDPVLSLSRALVEADSLKWLAQRRAWQPRLQLLGSAYARGSGGADVPFNGAPDRSLNGASLRNYNYALGVGLTFPLLDFGQNRTRVQLQQRLFDAAVADEEATRLRRLANTREAELQRTTVRDELHFALDRSAAAEAGYRQLLRRYRTGLVDLSEVLQAEAVLLQAEQQHVLAIVATWKAELAVAAAAGDLEPFLQLIDRAADTR